ncbi:MAG: nucleotide exchange factor GrpE [Acidimicrobiales bacterium]
MPDRDTVAAQGPLDEEVEPDDGGGALDDDVVGDESTVELAEEISADIASISAQRDEYLAVAQRLQAEFENYKKRVGRELADKHAAGKADLARRLLAVLDACDGAIIQGIDGVGPVHQLLSDVLTKEGLEIIEADGAEFDPNLHDAVAHEPATADDVSTVAETLRTGYLWNGRILRPAMVKVRG